MLGRDPTGNSGVRVEGSRTVRGSQWRSMGILWTGLRGDLEVRVGVSMVKGSQVPRPTGTEHTQAGGSRLKFWGRGPDATPESGRWEMSQMSRGQGVHMGASAPPASPDPGTPQPAPRTPQTAPGTPQRAPGTLSQPQAPPRSAQASAHPPAPPVPGSAQASHAHPKPPHPTQRSPGRSPGPPEPRPAPAPPMPPGPPPLTRGSSRRSRPRPQPRRTKWRSWPFWACAT